MNRLKLIEDKTIKCSCGKEQKPRDMKYRGIQEGIDFDGALYNCTCGSTCIVLLEKETGQKRGGIGQ